MIQLTTSGVLETVTQMITNHNAAYPGNDHGLGFEINQKWCMGGLAGPQTVGHTGFTGTSLVIDFQVASAVSSSGSVCDIRSASTRRTRCAAC